MPNSSNMNLPIPTVTKQPGPQYATDVNACLTTLDAHTHGPGSGVPIGAQGINLLSDLSFNVSNATNLRSVRFTPTTATSGTDTGCIYVKGIDLFYNDLVGNVVRITQNAGLSTSAQFQGLISTTAIVSAAGPTPATSGFIRMNNNLDFLSWRNAGNNADDKIFFDGSDNLQVIGPGPVAGVGGTGVQAWNFRFPDTNNSGKVVTAAAQVGTSAYSLLWPLRPTSATAPVFLNPDGTLATVGQISRDNLPALNQKFSTACGNITTENQTPVDIGNLNLIFATRGNPVQIGLIPTSTGALSYIGGTIGATNTRMSTQITLARNSVPIAYQSYTFNTSVSSDSQLLQTMPLGFTFIDRVPTSTYTYKAQINISLSAATGGGVYVGSINNAVLYASEY